DSRRAIELDPAAVRVGGVVQRIVGWIVVGADDVFAADAFERACLVDPGERVRDAGAVEDQVLAQVEMAANNRGGKGRRSGDAVGGHCRIHRVTGSINQGNGGADDGSDEGSGGQAGARYGLTHRKSGTGAQDVDVSNLVAAGGGAT